MLKGQAFDRKFPPPHRNLPWWLWVSFLLKVCPITLNNFFTWLVTWDCKHCWSFWIANLSEDTQAVKTWLCNDSMRLAWYLPDAGTISRKLHSLWWTSTAGRGSTGAVRGRSCVYHGQGMEGSGRSLNPMLPYIESHPPLPGPFYVGKIDDTGKFRLVQSNGGQHMFHSPILQWVNCLNIIFCFNNY